MGRGRKKQRDKSSAEKIANEVLDEQDDDPLGFQRLRIAEETAAMEKATTKDKGKAPASDFLMADEPLPPMPPTPRLGTRSLSVPPLRIRRSEHRSSDAPRSRRRSLTDADLDQFENPRRAPVPDVPEPSPIEFEWNSLTLCARSMNNFPAYPDSAGNMANNLPRQAPSPGPAQHQAPNGVGGAIGNMNGFPLAGQQADMNHLWNVVQQLSEALAENRAHTANIVNTMHQIQAGHAVSGSSSIRMLIDLRPQARATDEGVSPTIAQVNGELNASRAAELASLQSQVTKYERKIKSQEASIDSWMQLVEEFENAMTMTLEKLRPYAHNHTNAIIALHAHYNRLLEVERKANLDLRLEHQEWQARLLRLSQLIRLAHNEASEASLPYIRKIAALKCENRTLRRLAGWEEAVDSSDEEDEGASRREDN